MQGESFQALKDKDSKIFQRLSHLDIADPNSIRSEEPNLSQAEKQYISQMAITIPSGDNCQPFQLSWKDNSLKIFIKQQRAEHCFNNNNHASLLSLGCLLRCLDLCGSALNLDLDVTVASSFKNSLWATVDWVRKPRSIDPLVHEIAKRVTDRRNYKFDEDSNEVTNTILEIGKKYPLVHVSLVTNYSKEFKSFLAKSEGYLWKNTKAFKDFSEWLRLDQKETESIQDGVNYESLGLSKLDAVIFKLFRRWPRLAKWLWPIGLGVKVRMLTKKQLESSAAVYMYSVKLGDPKAIIQTGESSFETWLYLNSCEYGVQPLTVPTLSIFDISNKVQNSTMDKKHKQIFEDGSKVLAQDFNLPSGYVPLWMFRTGQSHDYPWESRTRRLKIEKFSFNDVEERHSVSLVGKQLKINGQKESPVNFFNVSRNGFCAKLDTPLSVNSFATVKLQNKNSEDFVVQCKVRWVSESRIHGFEILNPSEKYNHWFNEETKLGYLEH